MKIALDDPIWGRLYGPHGVEPVPDILEKLLEGWDEELANDLFWNKLYHQEDLYPVTYAALPWLWDVQKQHPEARAYVLGALSIFVHAMFYPPQWSKTARSCPPFPGLSLQVEDHHWDWLKPEEHLSQSDVQILAKLEGWLSARLDHMIATILTNAPNLEEKFAGDMLTGPACMMGAIQLSRDVEASILGGNVCCPACGKLHDALWREDRLVLEAFPDDDEDPFIDQGSRPDPQQSARERSVARELAAHFPPKHKVALFLTAWADWSCCDG
ncbi:hypothetical protein [Aliiroseovarius sp.]|uniref:hypothetical protein n=1 Tax=Aliiroseovarius sp. TaxID=1872442 RepID=UPI003BAD8D3B